MATNDDIDKDLRWTKEDYDKARAEGWQLGEYVNYQADGQVITEHYTTCSLEWVNKSPWVGKPSVIDHVCNKAALGEPLAMKAWRLYIQATLEGRSIPPKESVGYSIAKHALEERIRQ